MPPQPLGSRVTYRATYHEDGSPLETGAAHEDHAVARHRGGGRVVNVVHLKDDLAVGRHGDAVSIGKGQLLGVVQHRVEVLDPDCVHRAVQQQPDVLTLQQ